MILIFDLIFEEIKLSIYEPQIFVSLYLCKLKNISIWKIFNCLLFGFIQADKARDVIFKLTLARDLTTLIRYLNS